jgi:hypothetical protein
MERRADDVQQRQAMVAALGCDEFLWHGLPDTRAQSRNKVLQRGF